MDKSQKKLKHERIKYLKQTYEIYLEEEKERKKRNEYILKKLDIIQTVLVPHTEQLALKSNTLHVDPVEALPAVALAASASKYFQTTVPEIQGIAKLEETLLFKKITDNYILIPKAKQTDPQPLNDLKQSNETHSLSNDDWRSKYVILTKISESEIEKAVRNTNSSLDRNINSYLKEDIVASTTKNAKKWEQELPEKDLLDNSQTCKFQETTQRYNRNIENEAGHKSLTDEICKYKLIHQSEITAPRTLAKLIKPSNEVNVKEEVNDVSAITPKNSEPISNHATSKVQPELEARDGNVMTTKSAQYQENQTIHPNVEYYANKDFPTVIKVYENEQKIVTLKPKDQNNDQEIGYVPNNINAQTRVDNINEMYDKEDDQHQESRADNLNTSIVGEIEQQPYREGYDQHQNELQFQRYDTQESYPEQVYSQQFEENNHTYIEQGAHDQLQQKYTSEQNQQVYDHQQNFDQQQDLDQQLKYDHQQSIDPQLNYDQQQNLDPQLNYNQEQNIDLQLNNVQNLDQQQNCDQQQNHNPQLNYDQQQNHNPQLNFDQRINLNLQQDYDQQQDLDQQLKYDQQQNIDPQLNYDQQNLDPQLNYDQRQNLDQQQDCDQQQNLDQQQNYDQQQTYQKEGYDQPVYNLDEDGYAQQGYLEISDQHLANDQEQSYDQTHEQLAVYEQQQAYADQQGTQESYEQHQGEDLDMEQNSSVADNAIENQQ